METGKNLLNAALVVFAVLVLCLCNVVPATADSSEDTPEQEEQDLSVYRQFLNTIPQSGPGISVTTAVYAFEPEDLNDYLDDRGFEEITGTNLRMTDLYWTFGEHFLLGLGLVGGNSAAVATLEEESFNEASISLSGSQLRGYFKDSFGNDRWAYRVGGGLGVWALRLDLEHTPIGGYTTIEHYRGGAGVLLLDGALQFKFNNLLGVSLSGGLLGGTVEDVERSGEEIDDFPEIDMSGGFLGFGIDVHV